MSLKDEPTLFLFRKMLKFSDKKKVFFGIFFMSISYILWLFEIYLVGFILNKIQSEGISKENIFIIIFLFLSLIPSSIIAYGLHKIGVIINSKNAFLVKYRYRKYLLKNIFNLNLKWHNDQKSGDIIDKINKSSSKLGEFSETMYWIVDFFINFVFVYLILIFFNIHLLYIIPILFFLTIKIIFAFDKKLIPKYKEFDLKENKIVEKIFDYISNITTILILKIKKISLKNIKKDLKEPQKLKIELTKISENKWHITHILVKIFQVCPVSFYILFLYLNNSKILIGTITMIFMYSERISYIFYNFTYRYNQIIIGKAGVQNCEKIEKQFIKGKIEKKKIENWNKIEIKNLNFSYEEGKNSFTFKNLDFTIKRKEKIALIGKSGSGKTTFLKLLRGLYEEAHSEILVDKKSYDLQILANSTMLVPQEPEIFSSTILNNINMEIDELTERKIKKFSDMAQITKVIEKLPHKFQSNVNEKGVNLSGGEKQRLALARALLFSKNSDIVLLDESTSSVDNLNETKIYKNIFSNFKDKTFIATIHKLNLLHFFDKIYIFEKGKIIDSGSYFELLKRNKNFKKQIENYNKKLKKLNKKK